MLCECSDTVPQHNQNEMPTESNRLFLLWVAQHKHAIRLEEELALVGAVPATELAVRLADAQAQAVATLARAKKAFHAELVARGIRDPDERPSA